MALGRIGVISDTHGGVDGWERANQILEGVESILHAGDILNHGPLNPLPNGYNPKRLIDLINGSQIPILIAKGNCDSEVDELLLKIPLQPIIFLPKETFGVLVHHGHQCDDDGRVKLAQRYGASLIISGHTHTPKIENREGIILMNPGSPSIPLSGVLSCGMIEYDDKGITVKIYDLERNILNESRIEFMKYP